MPPGSEARTLALGSATPLVPGLSRRLGEVLGVSALVGLVATGVAVAAGAAARPSFLLGSSVIPDVRHAFPGWLAGPLAGLGPGLSASSFTSLVAVMCGCYLVALACASTVRPRFAVAAIALAHAAFVLAPPLLSPDVFAYVAYGRLGAVYGLNPYAHGAGAIPGDPIASYVVWPGLPSPYGPAFTLLTYPLAPLGVAGVWILKAAAGVASLACVALVWRGARRLGRPPVAAAMFVGLNPVLLVFGVGGAHNDFLLMALALAAVLWALSGREARAGGALAGAIGVKVSAGLLLPFLLLGARRRGRVLAGTLGTGIALALVSLASFGPQAAGLFTALGSQSEMVSGHSVPHSVGRLLGASGVTSELQAAGAAIFAAALVLLLLRTWRGANWVASAGWATFVLLVASIWLMPWYLAWLLPLAALGDDRRLRLAALGLTAFIVALRLGKLLGFFY